MERKIKEQVNDQHSHQRRRLNFYSEAGTIKLFTLVIVALD
jgi:hypothetical protein